LRFKLNEPLPYPASAICPAEGDGGWRALSENPRIEKVEHPRRREIEKPRSHELEAVEPELLNSAILGFSAS
jgi:hypothetical protein